MPSNIKHAVDQLNAGGVIAYPTRAVFGLGCDPFNELAVKKILTLKKRDIKKGLIVIASNWQQIEKFTQPIPHARLKTIIATWPGPHSWIFPASSIAPKWLTGEHTTIALRVSAHPVVQALCKQYDNAIVSTSANPEGLPPARSKEMVENYFNDQIDYIAEGDVDKNADPSTIQDALTGKQYR